MMGIITFSKEIVQQLEKALKEANKKNDLRVYKRVQCLLLIHQGLGFDLIAERLGIKTRTIYDWLRRFMVRRFSWLLGPHYKKIFRKSKLDKAQKQKLYKIVEAGPVKYGYDCGVWNTAMIADVIKKEFNVTYNPRYLAQLLNKIGLSYQKTKFISDKTDDEENRKKREQWDSVTWPEILKKSKTERAEIFFGDEVSFAQWGSLAKTWAPKGKQPAVKTCGKRKGMKLFGAIGFLKGDFNYMECEGKFNGETYLKFLTQLLERYAGPVILIEDGAPYHRGAAVKEFKEKKEKEGRLYVYRLPAYSPDKNPIEKLWKKTKKDATHCKYFPSFDDLRGAVITAFEKYLRDAAHVISIMKKLRAEAGIA